MSIVARQVSDGKVLWSKQYTGLILPSVAPAVAGNLVVTNVTGPYAFNATNGQELWHVSLSNVEDVAIGN